MYEENRPKRVANSGAKVVWSSMGIDALLDAYGEIVKYLPPIELSKMNLEKELLMQFHTVQNLQTNVLADEGIPPNQKAQVANTVAATLNKIVDMQQAVYETERFKLIENALIRYLNSRGEEVAAKFIEEYERIVARYAP